MSSVQQTIRNVQSQKSNLNVQYVTSANTGLSISALLGELRQRNAQEMPMNNVVTLQVTNTKSGRMKPPVGVIFLRHTLFALEVTAETSKSTA